MKQGITIFYFPLLSNITCIKISKDKKVLVSGYLNGSIQIHKFDQQFEFYCQEDFYSRNNENTKRSILELIFSRKEKSNRIIQVEFYDENNILLLSQKGEIIMYDLQEKKIKTKYQVALSKNNIPLSFDFT